MRTVAVVYNPGSGAAGQSLNERLAGMLSDRGVTAEFRAFDPATVGQDVRDLLTVEPDALLAAGGDGTVTAVAEHLVGSDVPLGVLPAGTMNVLARDLGVPENLENAVDALFDAPVRRIDVAAVNGRPFLCSSALALLPHLGRLRERARDSGPWAVIGLLAKAARLVRRYPRRRLHITVDGHDHTRRTRAVVVSNNPLTPGRVPMPGRERIDTGELAVYVTRDRTHWDLVGIAAKLLDGTWHEVGRLRTYRGRSVRIASSRSEMMSVMSDGEATTLTMPLEYEIRPAALAVLAPGAGP